MKAQPSPHRRVDDAVLPELDLRWLPSPEPMLRALCAALDVEYAEGMLHWEPGPRPTRFFECFAPLGGRRFDKSMIVVLELLMADC